MRIFIYYLFYLEFTGQKGQQEEKMKEKKPAIVEAEGKDRNAVTSGKIHIEKTIEKLA